MKKINAKIIDVFKNKTLKVGLLLVTLLFVFSLGINNFNNDNNVYAQETKNETKETKETKEDTSGNIRPQYKEGDRLKFVISCGDSFYELRAIVKDGYWSYFSSYFVKKNPDGSWGFVDNYEYDDFSSYVITTIAKDDSSSDKTIEKFKPLIEGYIDFMANKGYMTKEEGKELFYPDEVLQPGEEKEEFYIETLSKLHKICPNSSLFEYLLWCNDNDDPLVNMTHVSYNDSALTPLSEYNTIGYRQEGIKPFDLNHGSNKDIDEIMETVSEENKNIQQDEIKFKKAKQGTMEFLEGDEVTVSINAGQSLQYKIKATYENGKFTNYVYVNNFTVNGGKINGVSYINTYCNAVFRDKEEKKGQDYFLSESLNKEISKVLVALGIVDEDTAEKLSDGYEEYLNVDTIEKLKSLKDDMLFDYILNNHETDDGLGKYSSIQIKHKGDDLQNNDVVASNAVYSADFEITGSTIYINMYGDVNRNKLVKRFVFGTLTKDGKSFTEKKYTSADTKSMYLSYSNDYGRYFLTTNSNKPSGASLYYISPNTTIDSYKRIWDKQAWYLSALNSPVYVATKSSNSEEVILYDGTESDGGGIILVEQLRLSIDDLRQLLSEGEEVEEPENNIAVGEWVFETKGKTVIAYHADETDIDKNAYYYDFGNVKKMYVKDKDCFNLYVAVKKGKNSSYSYVLPKEDKEVFAVIRSTKNPTKKETSDSVNAVKSEYFNLLGEEGVTLYGVTISAKTENGEGWGYDTSHKIKLDDVYRDGSEPDGEDYPPDFPLNDILTHSPEIQKEIDKSKNQVNQYIDADISANLGNQKVEEKKSFLEALYKYGRIILLFLIFLAIVYTGILSIQSGADIEKRVLIKTRLKNILTGAIIFACSVPVFEIIISFTKQAYTDLGKIAKSYSGPTYYATVTRYKSGWIVNFIGKFVQLFADLMNWLVDEVLKRTIVPGESTELMQMIFRVKDETGAVSSILPFSENEWHVYMYGYQLLATVSIALIAIGLVKLSGDIILNSGNFQKISECKEQMKNILLTIVAIVLTPYAFRLLLLLFNYLTAMLPVDADDATFTITFESVGFAGAIANLAFATTRLRVYLSFLVRKVVMAVLLIASPIILGMRAISPKFRGFSVWLGELISQAAVQFCYGMVMLVVLLITYEGQSPFMILITVTIIPNLVSFFAKSLQGFGQRWGGLNTDRIAGDIVNGMKSAGLKAKAQVKKTGGTLMRASAFFDKDGVSKAGRRVHNVGAVLSGNVLDVRTKREMYSNQASVAADEAKKAGKNLRLAKATANPYLNNPVFKAYYDEMKEAHENGTDFERKSGIGYDEINDMDDKERDYQYQVERYNYFNDRKDTGVDRAQKVSKYAFVNALNEGIDLLTYGPISRMQRSASGFKSITDKETQDKINKFEKASDIKFVNTAELVNDVSRMQDLCMQAIKGNGGAKAKMEKIDTSKVLTNLSVLLEKDSSPTITKLDTSKELIRVMANFEMVKTGGQISDSMLDSMQKVTQSYAERIENVSNLQGDLTAAREKSIDEFSKTEDKFKNDIKAAFKNDFDPTATGNNFNGEFNNPFNNAQVASWGEEQTKGFGDSASQADSVGGRFSNVSNKFMGDTEGAPGESIILPSSANSPKGTTRIITGYDTGTTGRNLNHDETVEMILEGTGIDTSKASEMGAGDIGDSIGATNQGSNAGYNEAPDQFKDDSGEFNDDALDEVMEEETKKKRTSNEISNSIDDKLNKFEQKMRSNERNEAKNIVDQLIIDVSEIIEDKQTINISSSDIESARAEGERRTKQLDKAIDIIREVYPDVTMEYLEKHAHDIVSASRGGVSENNLDRFKIGHVAEINIENQRHTQKPR